MDIYLILRIAVVGILVSILNQILKQSNREELAFMTSLAGLIMVLFWILPYITELFATIKELFSML
ncbi:MAG: stage III sporulation protein AC [Herbinix sp.]|nr:stage III sporulation protein AC [Herbinix sp.]